MGIKNLFKAVDELLKYSAVSSDGGVENVIDEWNKLDVFVRRLFSLLKTIDEGGIITDASDIILVDNWAECDPDLNMFVRRMYILPKVHEITDPAELPEYLSNKDSKVTEVAKLKLEELTESKNEC